VEAAVITTALLAVLQLDPAVADAIRRIATLQLIMAISGGVVVLTIIALAVVGLQSLLALQRTLRTVELTVTRLAPRAEPVIDGARRIIEDTSDVTGSLKHRVKDTVNNLKRVNSALESASLEAEYRVREFGTVLRVVQEEMQEMLLDTAATARGIKTVAAAFHSPELPAARSSLEAGEAAEELLEDVTEAAVEADRRQRHGD
jgi:hypothetical protein